MLFVFTEVIEDLYNMRDSHSGKVQSLISDEHFEIIQKHAEQLNSAIIYDRDFSYNYFGFKVGF